MVKVTDKDGSETWVNPSRVDWISGHIDGNTIMCLGKKYLYFTESPEEMLRLLGESNTALLKEILMATMGNTPPPVQPSGVCRY